MGLCLMALGLGCIGIGVVIYLTGPRESGTAPIPFEFTPRPRTQGSPQPSRTDRAQSGFIPPMDAQNYSGDMYMDENGWRWITVGNRVRITHPTRGELTLHVLGRVRFNELWQQRRGAEVPWVPTGHDYFGYWCEQDILLLNWQTRYYVLDERDMISDVDIQRHFAERAREFGQSDQKADVYVAYPPTSWHLDDIGRFRVAEITGQAPRFVQGAEGRFIHGSSSDRRALVVEDYIGGGGQDSAWIGVVIDAIDVKAE